ncbi:acyl carrier protein [Pseudomonas sp. R1-15]|uniref:acyl carrier protein n=1 Tax=Pseudomonas sp. R1-15 TaxID=2817399 RepID=UPI003DA9C667
MSETKVIIRDIISKAEVGADASTLRDNINLTDQGIDSMDIFTIMLAVQDHYGIQIPDQDIESLRTIDDLAEYVVKLQQ